MTRAQMPSVSADARTLPLLITGDDLLLDDVLRLSAAAGTQLDVAHDVGVGLRGWAGASMVLVGADLAADLAGCGPPRRDRVHVVGRGRLDDGVFRAALQSGAQTVVELPVADTWLVDLLTDVTDASAGLARTIGVVAGSGGAGATTFACALALTAAARGPTLLLDLDPLGPGVDRVLGTEDAVGARWDALVSASGRLGSRALREALPGREDLAVLSWAPGETVCLEPASVREVLEAGRRGHSTVVADLPRGLDEVAVEVLLRCDRVLAVTGTTVAAIASTSRVLARLRGLHRRVELVTRGAGVEPDRVAEALSAPLVAHVASQRRLAEDIDLGLGPVRSRRAPLARAARAVLAGSSADVAA